MKKIVSFLLSLVLLVSCSNENEVLDFAQEPADNPASTIRTPDEALALAKQALNLGTTKSRSDLKLNKNNIVVVGSNPLSRGEASDTVIYAVNSEDNNGFVLVAAPRSCTKPILGIAENGSYDESVSENENFNYFMEQARKYAVKPKPIDSTLTLIPAYIEVPYCFIDGGIIYENVEWGQRWPENMFCPNGAAGCVPVAIAQTLAFFEYPAEIDITYSGASISRLSLNWADLKKHTPSTRIKYPTAQETLDHYYDCSLAISDHKTIGHLLRQLGNLASVTYSEDGTGTFKYGFDTAKKLLEGKDLSFIHGTNVDDLFNLFTNYPMGIHRIAMIRGVDSKNQTSHVWICDGYMQTGKKIEYYDAYTNELAYVIDETDKYLHMNWGWASRCNGFFLIDVINPAYGYDGHENPKTDVEADYDYSSGFKYMFIRPN